MRLTTGKNYSSAGWKGPLEICSPTSCSNQDSCQPYINMKVWLKGEEKESHYQTILKSFMQNRKHTAKHFPNKSPFQEQGDMERKMWICAQTYLENKDKKATIKFAFQLILGPLFSHTEKLLLWKLPKADWGFECPCARKSNVVSLPQNKGRGEGRLNSVIQLKALALACVFWRQ